MFSAIADGSATIRGFLAGEDCMATMAALRKMGVAISVTDSGVVVVDGVGLTGLCAPASPLDMGNSGTAMRLFAGLLCGQPFSSQLVGDASLSARPMDRILRPLGEMGAAIDSQGGLPPLSINATDTVLAIEYAMPVASAQVKSAVLLAGLYADGVTTVHEPAITRDHSERMLQSMGAQVENSDGAISIVGRPELRAVDIDVPCDLSSAAFPLLAAIIADSCEVTVRNVGINPTRDGVLRILQQMGAEIRIDNPRLLGNEPVADITASSSSLVGITVDSELVSLAIDEFPLLFIAAAYASGVTTFSGLAELRVKESDRIGAMAAGLSTLGVGVEERVDGAVVHGGRPTGGMVDSFGDHRIAMAFAVAATAASEVVRVRDTEAVATSFPDFAACLAACGGDIEQLEGKI